ncbi:MAG: ATP-binding protein [Thermoguttaceae bacterium]|jgi:ATP-dependent DNA helicase RecG
MTPAELKAKLDELMALPTEMEWVEFKEAKQNVHFDELGRYFSALSNEANIKGKEFGWLVLGVSNAPPRRVVGTQYRPGAQDRESLKHEVAGQTNNGMTFLDIHEIVLPEGRALLLQIPPALRGIPTEWKGHWYGRDGESLVPLGMPEIEAIRGQSPREDWSAQVCEGATLDALDPMAVRSARDEYKEKNPRLAAEVDQWDNATFLNKAKLCINGRITRTAILLLGKEESEHHLTPAVAKISWILRDEKGTEQDYQHFAPPLLLNVDQVFGKIRNLTYRYMRNERLFPTELSRYEPWVIREALHNAIAHQDYLLAGRIIVVEEPDSLLITNRGSFIPGTVEAVIRRDSPEDRYRNRLLADAMVNLNMIDSIGSGIKRMFAEQRKRFFPLPSFDLSEADQVKVRIFGKIIDENYTKMLMSQTDLELFEVIALDKVQKRMPITDEEFQLLKRRRLIEGRRPNVYVSSHIAAVTGARAAYIRNRGFDKDHYKQLVVSYLEKYGKGTRRDFEELLLNKMPDVLLEDQKRHQVQNLLQEMKRTGTIRTDPPVRGRTWLLHKPGQEGSV